MASTSAVEPSSAKKESPNWVEMPDKVMVNIFQRLPTVVVLRSVRRVCTTWRRICKYPTMWKVIRMLNPYNDLSMFDQMMILKSSHDWKLDNVLRTLTMEAVHLSRGGLLDISIDRFCTDEFLDLIVHSSKKLKRLCLVGCLLIDDSVLSLVVKRLPHLEKLHLHETCIRPETIEVIGRKCPQLKSFTLSDVYIRENDKSDEHAFAIAKSMRGLCHLELVDRQITNDGLKAILDGCPHLQSLHLRMCFKLDLDHDNLGKLCNERVKDFKHNSTKNSLDVAEFYEQMYFI